MFCYSSVYALYNDDFCMLFIGTRLHGTFCAMQYMILLFILSACDNGGSLCQHRLPGSPVILVSWY